MNLLAVVATPQERSALLRDLTAEPLQVGPYRGATTGWATVVVSGIGPAAAAAATATALALSSYDLVLSLGICGGFSGAAEIGDVVVATDLVAADLGADSPDGFLGLGHLGWAQETHRVDPVHVKAVAARLGEVVTGPVLTVSTVTGTDARAGLLAERHGAVAEAMEGWGVLEAARPYGLPVLEVRTVSNLVGRRDTSTWDFPRALAALTHVGAKLLE
ncbi:MAG: futalosine nucleosidase, partial [Frankiales bacterium]|nr:futalosine nucleosidase [Frankiales bacterium]